MKSGTVSWCLVLHFKTYRKQKLVQSLWVVLQNTLRCKTVISKLSTAFFCEFYEIE